MSAKSLLRSVKKRRQANQTERRTKTINLEPVARYSYSEFIILACLLIYTYAGHSLRGTAKTIEVFDFLLGKTFASLPQHTTIKTWIEKAGLDIYRNRKLSLNEVYGIIIDGSITIGGQQMLLQLKVPDEHPGHSLTHADTEVIGMKVADSWPSQKVAEELLATSAELGKEPSYILSDNGSNLCKASRDLKLKHHRDISHSFGLFLERVYKEDAEFKSFMESMGKTRRYALTSVAYLMPPKQRSIARFMNMFNGVEWARCMLDNFYKLSSHERFYYSFLLKHSSIVDELSEVMELYEQTLSLCKGDGLSVETAARCKVLSNQLMLSGSVRMRRLQEYIIDYFNKETSLLKSSTEIHNISSDVIESTFGFYKGRKSPNKNYGVTTLALIIPLHTKLAKLDNVKCFNLKRRMEATTINHIKEWKLENLQPSQVSKRNFKLASGF